MFPHDIPMQTRERERERERDTELASYSTRRLTDPAHKARFTSSPSSACFFSEPRSWQDPVPGASPQPSPSTHNVNSFQSGQPFALRSASPCFSRLSTSNDEPPFHWCAQVPAWSRPLLHTVPRAFPQSAWRFPQP